jgi:hypothetical protein
MEMIRPGRRGYFTLVSDNRIGVLPLEIDASDRKELRKIGAFIFDCEGFAKHKAAELNEEMHPGRFQPWGKWRVLTFPKSREQEDES